MRKAVAVIPLSKKDMYNENNISPTSNTQGECMQLFSQIHSYLTFTKLSLHRMGIYKQVVNTEVVSTPLEH